MTFFCWWLSIQHCTDLDHFQYVFALSCCYCAFLLSENDYFNPAKLWRLHQRNDSQYKEYEEADPAKANANANAIANANTTANANPTDNAS